MARIKNPLQNIFEKRIDRKPSNELRNEVMTELKPIKGLKSLENTSKGFERKISQEQAKMADVTSVSPLVQQNFKIINNQFNLITKQFQKVDKKFDDFDKVVNEKLIFATNISIKQTQGIGRELNKQFRIVSDNIKDFDSRLDIHDNSLDKIKSEIEFMKMKLQENDIEKGKKSPVKPKIPESTKISGAAITGLAAAGGLAALAYYYKDKISQGLAGLGKGAAIGAKAATGVKLASKAVIVAAIKKVAPKWGIQATVKKIPGAGLLFGLGLAAYRYAIGDNEGAKLEIASGASSTVPGIGTVASLSFDIGIFTRDVYFLVYNVYPKDDPESPKRWKELYDTCVEYITGIKKEEEGKEKETLPNGSLKKLQNYSITGPRGPGTGMFEQAKPPVNNSMGKMPGSSEFWDQGKETKSGWKQYFPSWLGGEKAIGESQAGSNNRNSTGYNPSVAGGNPNADPESFFKPLKSDPNDKFGSMEKTTNWSTRRDSKPGEFNWAKSKEGQEYFGTPGDKNNLTTITAPNGQKVTVHKKAAARIGGFLDDLKGRGYDMKSVGGYSYRNIAGTNSLSTHATGTTVDIDPYGLGNDYKKGAKKNKTVLPPNSEKLGWLYGMSWGGAFGDTMHFETMSPSLWSQRLVELYQEGFIDEERLKEIAGNNNLKIPEKLPERKIQGATKIETAQPKDEDIITPLSKRGMTEGMKNNSGDGKATFAKPMMLGGPKSAAEEELKFKVDRSQFEKELQNPNVKEKLRILMGAEVGSQGPEAQQAFLETVFNRAQATGKTIDQIISNKKYYQPYQDGGFNRSKNRMNDSLRKDYDKLIDAVQVDGSDLTGGATHNASAGVARSVRRGGYDANMSSIKEVGGETYYNKTFEQKGIRENIKRVQVQQNPTGPKISEGITPGSSDYWNQGRSKIVDKPKEVAVSKKPEQTKIAKAETTGPKPGSSEYWSQGAEQPQHSENKQLSMGDVRSSSGDSMPPMPGSDGTGDFKQCYI